MNSKPSLQRFVGTGREGLTEVKTTTGSVFPPSGNSLAGIATDPISPGQVTYSSVPVVSDKDFLAAHREEKAVMKAMDEKRRAAKDKEARQQKMLILQSLSRTTIVDLDEHVTVKLAYPIHSFSQGARRFITDMASAFQVHESIPGTMLLGVASVISQGKFKVQRHGNHVEQGTLYCLVVMPSGKLKSPTLEACMKPIVDLEKDLQELAIEGEKEHRVKRRLLRKRIHQLETKAAKSGELDAFMADIKELEEGMPPEFTLPVFSLSKFTPEGLEKEAMRQNGRIAIVAAELGSFKKLQANKDDFILMGYVGEDYVFLKSENPVVIRNPSVSILLATQGITAIKLLNDSDLQEDGLIARFISLVPPDVSNLYPGGALTSEVPAACAEWLDKTLRAIHAIPRPSEGYTTLTVDEAALREWEGFAHHVKVQAESKDNSAVLKTFYRKLAGTALRLSCFLQMLACVEKSILVESEPIGLSAIRGGIELAQFYEQHAKIALDIQGSEALSRAHKLVEDFRNRRDLEVNVRKLYRQKKWSKDETMAALKILAAHGFVALHQYENTVTCLVNPNMKQVE